MHYCLRQGPGVINVSWPERLGQILFLQPALGSVRQLAGFSTSRHFDRTIKTENQRCFAYIRFLQ